MIKKKKSGFLTGLKKNKLVQNRNRKELQAFDKAYLQKIYRFSYLRVKDWMFSSKVLFNIVLKFLSIVKAGKSKD